MTRFLLTTRLVEHVCTVYQVPFATPRTLYRRLNKLRKSGLIDRSRLLHNGEFCYHLTKQGAELVAERDGLSVIPRKAVITPNISLQAHEFEVSRFWIKFFSDCHKINLPDLHFWRDGSFVHTAKTGKLIPDGTALLKIKGKTKAFFLEMDRGTQTRGNEVSERGIIAQKFRRYQSFSRSFRRHPDLAPYKPHAMKLIVVCQTEQRMQSLCDLAASMGLGKWVCFICIDRYLDITNANTAQGWQYKRANLFATPLFSIPARSPPVVLL